MTAEPKRKPGRPTLPPAARATARVEVRLSPAQKAEWDRRGGARWLKGVLNAQNGSGAPIAPPDGR